MLIFIKVFCKDPCTTLILEPLLCKYHLEWILLGVQTSAAHKENMHYYFNKTRIFKTDLKVPNYEMR